MTSPGQRIEIPPAEQRESLRRARDHYRALADAIRDAGPVPPQSREDWLAREVKVRRIALAYQRSFENQSRLMGSPAKD